MVLSCSFVCVCLSASFVSRCRFAICISRIYYNMPSLLHTYVEEMRSQSANRVFCNVRAQLADDRTEGKKADMLVRIDHPCRHRPIAQLQTLVNGIRVFADAVRLDSFGDGDLRNNNNKTGENIAMKERW